MNTYHAAAFGGTRFRASGAHPAQCGTGDLACAIHPRASRIKSKSIYSSNAAPPTTITPPMIYHNVRDLRGTAT
jgi:hypothetical protein